MAEWLRRVAFVCITTEGLLVRIALAANVFAFLFLLLLSIAMLLYIVQLRQRGLAVLKMWTGAK